MSKLARMDRLTDRVEQIGGKVTHGMRSAMSRLLIEARVDGRTALFCSRENANPYAAWAAVANEITTRLGHARWTVGRSWVNR